MMVLDLPQASGMSASKLSWSKGRLDLDQGYLPIQARKFTLICPHYLGTQVCFGSVGMVAIIQSR